MAVYNWSETVAACDVFGSGDIQRSLARLSNIAVKIACYFVSFRMLSKKKRAANSRSLTSRGISCHKLLYLIIG